MNLKATASGATEFGTALEYIPKYLSEPVADDLLHHCRTELPWQEELVQMFGKIHVAPRLSCAIADKGCVYRYRDSQMRPIEFTKSINDLREQLTKTLRVQFNYVLATIYRSGTDYVGWHADDERDLIPGVVIANVSLGATRMFRVKSRDASLVQDIPTEHGSLLLMHGHLQRETKHMLVKTRKVVSERIVLSFRQVVS